MHLTNAALLFLAPTPQRSAQANPTQEKWRSSRLRSQPAPRQLCSLKAAANCHVSGAHFGFVTAALRPTSFSRSPFAASVWAACWAGSVKKLNNKPSHPFTRFLHFRLYKIPLDYILNKIHLYTIFKSNQIKSNQI